MLETLVTGNKRSKMFQNKQGISRKPEECWITASPGVAQRRPVKPDHAHPRTPFPALLRGSPRRMRRNIRRLGHSIWAAPECAQIRHTRDADSAQSRAVIRLHLLATPMLYQSYHWNSGAGLLTPRNSSLSAHPLALEVRRTSAATTHQGSPGR
jgi:hypothetical protein